MVTTGDHDDRVVPAHSFKFAAELQEKQGGPAPVLIRIETDAGHGAGTPVSKTIAQYADIYGFTLYNMGYKVLPKNINDGRKTITHSKITLSLVRLLGSSFFTTLFFMLNVTIKDFSYPNTPEVLILKDIVFSLKEGEHLVVLGESGCGKSTLATLNLRAITFRKWPVVLERKTAIGAPTQSCAWGACYEISSSRI